MTHIYILYISLSLFTYVYIYICSFLRWFLQLIRKGLLVWAACGCAAKGAKWPFSCDTANCQNEENLQSKAVTHRVLSAECFFQVSSNVQQQRQVGSNARSHFRVAALLERSARCQEVMPGLTSEFAKLGVRSLWEPRSTDQPNQTQMKMKHISKKLANLCFFHDLKSKSNKMQWVRPSGWFWVRLNKGNHSMMFNKRHHPQVAKLSGWWNSIIFPVFWQKTPGNRISMDAEQSGALLVDDY